MKMIEMADVTMMLVVADVMKVLQDLKIHKKISVPVPVPTSYLATATQYRGSRLLRSHLFWPFDRINQLQWSTLIPVNG